MQTTRHRHGYTLIELLTVIGALGVIAVIALPRYSDYLDSARSVKTGVHFSDAVRIAGQEFVKHQQLTGLGQPGSLPVNEDEWILRFDNNGTAVAPGGGPAFIANSAGDSSTGAIGIIWDSADERLIVHRPVFEGVGAASTEITAEETRHLPASSRAPVDNPAYSSSPG